MNGQCLREINLLELKFQQPWKLLCLRIAPPLFWNPGAATDVQWNVRPYKINNMGKSSPTRWAIFSKILLKIFIIQNIYRDIIFEMTENNKFENVTFHCDILFNISYIIWWGNTHRLERYNGKYVIQGRLLKAVASWDATAHKSHICIVLCLKSGYSNDAGRKIWVAS